MILYSKISIFFIFILLLSLNNLIYGEEEIKEGKPIKGAYLTGDIRIFENFHSKFLNNNRTILVYLPPGYSESNDKHYPVLYLQDGQNVFNKETSFIGIEWGLDEIAEKLIKEGKIKDIIMVAIYNNENRMSEYTPVKDEKYGGGDLAVYANFVVKELKPFIDKTFNTSKSPSDTGFMGSSLGGISALYMGWNYSDVFELIGVISPSLWWGDKYFLKEISTYSGQKLPLKIWLDMGTKEYDGDEDKNGISDIIEYSRAMRDILLEKGYIEGKDLYYYEAEGAIHNEGAWSKRADKILIYLFGKEE